MAISLNQLVRAAHPKPPIIVVYGVHGVGKSTFAAQAPSPVFIQTEDGLGMGVPVVTWPQSRVVSRQTHAFLHQIGLPELSASVASFK